MLAAACDCGPPERLRAVMLALRHLAVGTARNVSFYGIETIYIDQHSRRRTLKIYDKGLEVAQHPIPRGVSGRAKLTKRAGSLLRFEFTLRAQELERLGLSDPESFTPKKGRRLLEKQFAFVTRAKGVVPDLALASKLPRSCQTKLRAWALGDTAAFADSPTTLASNRRQVLKATGIDIGSPIDAETQRQALLTVRQVLARGLGFKPHPKAWKRLTDCAGAGVE